MPPKTDCPNSVPELPTRHPVNVLFLTFSFQIQIEWFKLGQKVDIKGYLGQKQVLKIFIFGPSKHDCPDCFSRRFIKPASQKNDIQPFFHIDDKNEYKCLQNYYFHYKSSTYTNELKIFITKVDLHSMLQKKKKYQFYMEKQNAFIYSLIYFIFYTNLF